jgi:hypothetical protein
MASKPVTLAEARRAITLYQADISAAEVAGMLGRSKDTVLAILRANHVPIRRRGAPGYDRASEKCGAFEKMAEDARFGSQMLLAAIQRAGVRP